MSLPKLNTPTYELKLSSIKEPVKYRPFLVKEEKLMMIASETGDEKNIINSVVETVNACTFNKLDLDKIPMYDIELLFLNIRAKSVGEVIKVNVTCPDDMKTTVVKEINIKDVKIIKNDNHKDVVKINDTVKLVLKHPTLSVTKLIKKGDAEDVFKILPSCIKTVYDGEKMIEDFTHQEAEDFINNLSSEQFKNLQDFFMTMPKLKHDVEVENPNTKVKSTVSLEGMQSFF